MAKSEIDMIRDILGWSIPNDRKLGLIRDLVGGKPAAGAALAPAPAASPAVRGRGRPRKAAAEAPAGPPKAPARRRGRPRKTAEHPPERVVKHRRRSLIRGEGSAYTRRSQLWSELKRLAPEKLQGLAYTKVSNEQLEPLLEEARKRQVTSDNG